MSSLTPWFQKRWSFEAVPTEAWPEILERLRGAPIRLAALVSEIPEDRLVAAPRDGDWTVQEHVGHLGDIESLFDGRLDDFLANEESLREADLTNRLTYEAGHTESDVLVLVEVFRDRRDAFVRRLVDLDAEVWGRTALHPRLKEPMRLLDSAIFQADHDNWHLARMRELSQA